MQDIFHQEIYVQAVPPGGAKYPISAAGGEAPMWRREGKELFYISADRKLTAVPITLGSTVVAGSPQPLFTFPNPPLAFSTGFYTPLRDGQRFLVNITGGGENAAEGESITVVTNWQAGAKK
jgi:eukaryotic-like serine/threonine-protein kinase